MRSNKLIGFGLSIVAVLFAYGTVNAQIVDKIKSAADKTKDVTVETTKKTTVVVTDALETAGDKTKDAADDTGDKVKSTAKTFGSHTVNVTENIAGEAYEGGRWFVVTTWDGTKWVSKRVMFKAKKVVD